MRYARTSPHTALMLLGWLALAPLMLAAEQASPASSSGGDGAGLRWVGMLVVPMFSVFLGMLFGLRYQSTLETLDQALRDAGEEGLSEGQQNYLRLARTIVIGSVILFVVSLLPLMLFGVSLEAGETLGWTVTLALITHLIMSLSLLVICSLDLKMGVCRTWLRTLLIALALAGVAGCIILMVAFDPREVLAGSIRHKAG